MTSRKEKQAKPPINTSEFIGLLRQYFYDNPGVTRRAFAERIDMEPGAFSRLMRTKRRRPSPETVAAVAHEIGLPTWTVAVAADYPFDSPAVPGADDERLFRLIQADPEIRSAIERYFGEISPEKRESMLQVWIAMLDQADKRNT